VVLAARLKACPDTKTVDSVHIVSKEKFRVMDFGTPRESNFGGEKDLLRKVVKKAFRLVAVHGYTGSLDCARLRLMTSD